VGLSPIQNAALTINRDNAIQAFSLGYFQDAPHPVFHARLRPARQSRRG